MRRFTRASRNVAVSAAASPRERKKGSDGFCEAERSVSVCSTALALETKQVSFERAPSTLEPLEAETGALVA